MGPNYKIMNTRQVLNTHINIPSTIYKYLAGQINGT